MAAQEKPPAPKKKPAPRGNQVAHKKPTPQQVRKFEELEQKRDPAANPERKPTERKRETK